MSSPCLYFDQPLVEPDLLGANYSIKVEFFSTIRVPLVCSAVDFIMAGTTAKSPEKIWLLSAHPPAWQVTQYRGIWVTITDAGNAYLAFPTLC